MSNQSTYIQKKITIQNSGCVNALAVIEFNQKNYLFSASGSIIQIWYYSNSDLINIANLTQQTNVVTSLAFNPNSSLLASSSTDLSITIWNVASYRLNTKAYMDNCSNCFVSVLIQLL